VTKSPSSHEPRYSDHFWADNMAFHVTTPTSFCLLQQFSILVRTIVSASKRHIFNPESTDTCTCISTKSAKPANQLWPTAETDIGCQRHVNGPLNPANTATSSPQKQSHSQYNNSTADRHTFVGSVECLTNPVNWPAYHPSTRNRSKGGESAYITTRSLERYALYNP
jgi:hypothetical protein